MQVFTLSDMAFINKVRRTVSQAIAGTLESPSRHTDDAGVVKEACRAVMNLAVNDAGVQGGEESAASDDDNVKICTNLLHCIAILARALSDKIATRR